MKSGEWYEALAPAKVNLRLAILGRRADGFHELDTIMLAIDLADRLRARAVERPGLRLRVSGQQAGAEVPTDERNLAYQAAQAVLSVAGEGRGLELELEKKIPSGAGLGGASSDAAAALLVSQVALGIDLGAPARRALLAGLGSDCVFFHEATASGFARCLGRGERVEPLGPAPSAWWLVLVTPDLHSSTAKVYHALDLPLCTSPAVPTLRQSEFAEPLARVRRSLFNQLEEPALGAVRGLGAWKETLDGGGTHRMQLSGSGSTFFGLHADRGAAEQELERVESALEQARLRPRLVLLARAAGHGAVLLGREG